MAQCQESRAQMGFFWSSPVFGKKILQKSQSARAPIQCKSDWAITWFVGVTMYCIFFNNNEFTSSSPVFMEQNTFEKN